MPVSSTYRTYILEQLSPLGSVTARPMFGGLGLYHDGRFFGLVDDDTLYLKVDDTSRADYERAGMGPFRPSAEEGPTLGYYQVPAEVLEDRMVLRDWAATAVEVARRKAATRAKRPKPRS
jgi:DNA transformation protein and related proteins